MAFSDGPFKPQVKSPLNPPRTLKRVRASDQTDGGLVGKRRRINGHQSMVGILRGIYTLPVELVQEVQSLHSPFNGHLSTSNSQIFIRLHPRDLVSLSRANKALRHTLISFDWRFLWQSARLTAPGLSIPEPPEGTCEPAWAHLLFGPAVCWVCFASYHVLTSCYRPFYI
ncbi:hypothetical protein BC834DRAFT_512121 [Gloeopeniophorella convolvens]|nr:hypothetical protein BC834DRAFT_512121 [Gloeopeniophorella convolvens]